MEFEVTWKREYITEKGTSIVTGETMRVDSQGNLVIEDDVERICAIFKADNWINAKPILNNPNDK